MNSILKEGDEVAICISSTFLPKSAHRAGKVRKVTDKWVELEDRSKWGVWTGHVWGNPLSSHCIVPMTDKRRKEIEDLRKRVLRNAYKHISLDDEDMECIDKLENDPEHDSTIDVIKETLKFYYYINGGESEISKRLKTLMEETDSRSLVQTAIDAINFYYLEVHK